MATKTAFKAITARTSLDVCLGNVEKTVGRLVYVKDGPRAFSQFAYSEAWLTDPQYFDISSDLTRQTGYQLRKPPSKNDSCFFLALADTEPDAWGRRVIARAHAKARAKELTLGPLTEIDYLAAVDDFSRMGALRLRDKQGEYLRRTKSRNGRRPQLPPRQRHIFGRHAAQVYCPRHEWVIGFG